MTITDRANTIATAVLQAIGEMLRTDPALRATLVELLADEIEDAVRQAVSEIHETE